jgi:magnesium transporter
VTTGPDAEDRSSDEFLGQAAQQAVASIPTAAPGQAAREVRDGLTGKSFDYAGEIAVVQAGRLVGIVAIERLLEADDSVPMAELADPEPPVVAPDLPQEAVAWRMVKRGESAVGVVGADGHFKGLIPAHRMVGALLAEHDEDLARLGGYLASTRRARLAAEEPVRRRLWHRLPWLVVGLAGAMASTVIVGAFESELSTKVLLAFFLPGVVYMADAVGTQTETVLIRGLSVGVNWPDVLRRELVTGLAIGLVIAAVFMPFALLGWGDGRVALAVGIALFASCSIATVVAMILPLTFQRIGADPAFGSGPLGTIIQDLLSIAVYLVVAAAIAL